MPRAVINTFALIGVCACLALGILTIRDWYTWRVNVNAALTDLLKRPTPTPHTP